MRLFLKLLFGGIFLWMTVMTIRTSLAVSLWGAWPSYAANPWAVATLWDAYFGFLTFYVWVVYKERKTWARILWFLLIMGLGNIAMSLYVLIQLMRLRGDEQAETILWRRAQ
jgi:predicted permease